MELFDKKFVYFTWDDVLLDKQVFVADYISDLKRNVNAGNYNKVKVKESDREDFPFHVSADNDDNDYTFAYYDPLYDYKVAYNKGEGVEYRSKGSNTKWVAMEAPVWDAELYEYRCSETIATNREVAEWLSKGNGQVRRECTISTDYEYGASMDKAVCSYKVRKWGDGEWHNATHEYLGIKEN